MHVKLRPLIVELQTLLSSKQSIFCLRKWIRTPSIELYVRITSRLHPITREVVPCLDLATIEISEKSRGKGLFRELIATLPSLENMPDLIILENVNAPRLNTHANQLWHAFPQLPNTFYLQKSEIAALYPVLTPA